MIKRTSTITALLLSTAFIAPAAYAQEEPAAENPEANEDVPEEEEEVEISAPGSSNEIVVQGRFIPNVVRSTPEVVSVLGQEEIARTAEGDIAGSLSRVTGLSVVGGRFVFVRGLGERYSSALLNGSPLPSPEPLRRVVPLDLFPTSVIGSTTVQKSYSANFPGEFGGGLINLTTKSAPRDPFLDVSFGISGNSETTGEVGYTYDGSDFDWFGFDSGLRDLPTGLANALAQGVPVSTGANFTTEDLQGFASSLVNAQTSLIQRNFDIPPNFSAEISGGTNFDVGDVFVGVFGTAGISNGFRTRGGQQQGTNGIVNGGGGTPVLGVDQDFNYLTTENRITVNGLFGLTAEFGENVIRFTNLFVRDSSKEASIREGFNFANVGSQALNLGRTSWFERQLFSTQIVAEFEWDQISLDVRASYANSQREAPYERSYSYAFDNSVFTDGAGNRFAVNDFVNDLTSPGQTANISFSDLNDDVYGAGFDLGYEFDAGIPITLTAGYNYYLNERAAERRDFRFLPTQNIPQGVDQERIDFLLSDLNIDLFGIELVEQAASNSVPRYEAELEVHAGYLQADAELIDGLRLNLGVRYETADETVLPITLGSAIPGVATNLSNDYWLPAGTLTWNFIEDFQLRIAASKTIARPQFRELAQQQFLDLESDRTFVGNPGLTDSELFNAEARVEWYPGRDERVSVAAFYKDIDAPIDGVAFRQGDTLFATFANAPSALLYGAEVEVVKFFPLYGLGGEFFEERRLLLAANYTYTQSEIKVADGDMTINPITLQPIAASSLFDDGDPLSGQSDHLVNLQFGMELEGNRVSQQTILLTYNSNRVTQRGPNNQPDLIEDTGVRVDIVLREGFNIGKQPMELKFEARNIFGESYIESQELNDSIIVNNSYDYGTTFSASLTLNF